ncbi:cytochrome P450 [Patellaria atrata CBS 101060]|uniref:Cytochrome P450 n=1 Tax=Patellaria atrata CBS 101060 TaxID=1346257 RepID=A0A9P4S8I1_9PEZI|nr:cytochrome P450 [Patellaria atrata CBS 101060]
MSGFFYRMRLPGPKGIPIIGSVYEVPRNRSWLKFAKWGQKYGPIYRVNLAGINHVWITTDDIAIDLPHIPALIADNRTSAQYLPLLSKNKLEALRMLVELMDDPSQYNHTLESFIARVTCRLAWGHAGASDELKQRARELLISVSLRGHLGNKLPNEDRNRSSNFSWMSLFLDRRHSWEFQYDLEGAYAVGMHGIAGALTIAAPIQTFSLIQEEFDRVCGDRPPRQSDKPSLPALRAMIREVFRWRPPVPSGIPHYLTEDDECNGYHIPSGSVVHPLEWSISRDPTLFPDPETFNPLRWLLPEYPTYRGPLTQFPTILNCTQFGYGKRTCQGQTVTEADLLVSIGSLAWLFSFAKKNSGVSDRVGNAINNDNNNGLFPGVLGVDVESGTGIPDTHTGPDFEEEADGHDNAKTVDPFQNLTYSDSFPQFSPSPNYVKARGEVVRKLFAEKQREGAFEKAWEFWGKDKGQGMEFGWGKLL